MTIETYRKYRRILKNTEYKGKLVPYDWGRLPPKLYFAWMPYSQMFDEFSRELANSLNALTGYTHQLAAWRDLLEPMNQQQKIDVAVEFVTPLATVALNMPYAIKSRFIFAAAHLSHQANKTKQTGTWKDDLPMDGEIWFDSADFYGKPWKRYNALKRKIERIGAKDYTQATNDFRNSYNHRFSPRIVIGVSNFVNRKVDKTTSQVSYGFGYSPALTLSIIVEALEKQCDLMYQAFLAFQELVREQEAEIITKNTEYLAIIEK
ncbi:hypothetical protein [Comamonas fluminis]|uniref:hypothetical protein n=1 Tax=Comamonas fluminis TaxID=2796366 RepID=UPI001C45C358|nr:hypothetical protein [Comamonas fluminis]